MGCTGGNNGAIDITVNGGSPAYSYHWSNGATTQDLSGLAAGTYTVTVTDTHNCMKVQSFVVEQFSDVTASAVGTNPTCASTATGSVDLTVSGGLTPYTYHWSNNATSEDLSNVVAGTYAVTVTDANGCTAVASVYTG
jgi:hypothetical protein